MLNVSKAQALHLLTVFVITPVSGFVTAWVAKNFPGLPKFDPAEVSAFFLAGATTGLGLGIHYLRGLRIWQELEKFGVVAKAKK
jgi:hypothetical protein